MKRAKFVSAYRGISLRQFVIDSLEQHSSAELERIHEEMNREGLRRAVDFEIRDPSDTSGVTAPGGRTDSNAAKPEQSTKTCRGTMVVALVYKAQTTGTGVESD